MLLLLPHDGRMEQHSLGVLDELGSPMATTGTRGFKLAFTSDALGFDLVPDTDDRAGSSSTSVSSGSSSESESPSEGSGTKRAAGRDAGGAGGSGSGKRIKAAPACRGCHSRAQPRNLVQKLQLRELARHGHRQLLATHADGKFRELHHNPSDARHVYDTHDPAYGPSRLSFLRERSRIIEVVSAQHVIFALTHKGVCAAFSTVTGQRICYLNSSSNEVLRSLFYNKTNESLITVAVFRDDNFSSLKCRSTPLPYILANRPADGFPIFASESLCYPGFVEFDDVNSKVLTFSATDQTYKVWELMNYEELFAVAEKGVEEIKISPGVMLVIYECTESAVPLKLLSIETGQVLKTLEHALVEGKALEFIEQFNDFLLVKQAEQNMKIVDVRSSAVLEVSTTEFLAPNAFIFLYEKQLFLTFRGRNVEVWNFRGELVTRFEDHSLFHESPKKANMIFITTQQDLIISYCKSGAGHGHGGSINISKISTGELVGKIVADAGSGTEAVFEDITALFYNEDANEIYTGSERGVVCRWAVCEPELRLC